MPPFQGDTLDLHYGVVVNGSLKSTFHSLKTEEASTSPLLLDTQTTHSHNALIQAEHERLEQEAMEIRRVKFDTCCLKILLAVDTVPTLLLLLCIFASILVVLMAVGLWTVLFRRKTIPPALVWSIWIGNVASLYWYQAWIAEGWVLPLLGAILNVWTLLQYYKFCRTKQTHPDLWRHQGEWRQKELFVTYMGTIKNVAESVYNLPQDNHNNNNSHRTTTTTASTTTELREFYTTSPSEGLYGDHESQLFLLFPRCDSPKGWWIRGARKGRSGCLESIVLEGFVSPTYQAYWTEGTLNGKENTLYYGKFDGPQLFTGEWLSYSGKRRHQYKLDLSTAADPDRHLGVVCSACERNALPGICYVAKDQSCCYCQSCVDHENSLVNEAEYVGLQLPEVCRCNSEDQHYDPPLNDSSIEDLELGLSMQ